MNNMQLKHRYLIILNSSSSNLTVKAYFQTSQKNISLLQVNPLLFYNNFVNDIKKIYTINNYSNIINNKYNFYDIGIIPYGVVDIINSHIRCFDPLLIYYNEFLWITDTNNISFIFGNTLINIVSIMPLSISVPSNYTINTFPNNLIQFKITTLNLNLNDTYTITTPDKSISPPLSGVGIYNSIDYFTPPLSGVGSSSTLSFNGDTLNLSTLNLSNILTLNFNNTVLIINRDVLFGVNINLDNSNITFDKNINGFVIKSINTINSNLIINGSILKINNCINITSSNLTYLNDDIKNGTVLLEYNCINGTFDNIKTTSGNGSNCISIVYLQSQLMVLTDVNNVCGTNSEEDKYFLYKVIIPILFCVIIISVIIIVLIFKNKKLRKIVMPHRDKEFHQSSSIIKNIEIKSIEIKSRRGGDRGNYDYQKGSPLS
jgi:hypothetical protein